MYKFILALILYAISNTTYSSEYLTLNCLNRVIVYSDTTIKMVKSNNPYLIFDSNHNLILNKDVVVFHKIANGLILWYYDVGGIVIGVKREEYLNLIQGRTNKINLVGRSSKPDEVYPFMIYKCFKES